MLFRSAPTVLRAGDKENVVPSEASAVLNCRILPGDDVAGVVEHIRKTINDERVSLRVLGQSSEPSAVSDPSSQAFRLLATTVRRLHPESIVVPSLMIAASDARHYRGISENIFRFSPITLDNEGLDRFHGTNERISVEEYKNCIRFYRLLLSGS